MYPQNHDMDDLFRRAAARYPLETGNSNWEMVAQKLQVAANPATGKDHNRAGKYYALLLLIPVSFLFHNALRNTHAIHPTNKSSLVTVTETKSPQQAKAPVIKSTKRLTLVASDAGERIMVASLPKRITHDFTINALEIPVNPVEQERTQTPKTVSPQKGFYLGASAGIDFGTVKGQSFTNAGSNLGLLIGYRFDKHWSFETGITWITKKYYTRGEHFSMKKIEDNMPGGMEMMAVKGRLSLLEIPYKLKYDFLLKERSNFFVAAGASTNIYIKEENEYHTRLNGIPQVQQASYRDLHCAPLCLMHVSAGYEHIFRNKNRLRLEPYVKFPLQKVGMGSVPLLSVGLNVTVTNF